MSEPFQELIAALRDLDEGAEGALSDEALVAEALRCIKLGREYEDYSQRTRLRNWMVPDSDLAPRPPAPDAAGFSDQQQVRRAALLALHDAVTAHEMAKRAFADLIDRDPGLEHTTSVATDDTWAISEALTEVDGHYAGLLRVLASLEGRTGLAALVADRIAAELEPMPEPDATTIELPGGVITVQGSLTAEQRERLRAMVVTSFGVSPEVAGVGPRYVVRKSEGGGSSFRVWDTLKDEKVAGFTHVGDNPAYAYLAAEREATTLNEQHAADVAAEDA